MTDFGNAPMAAPTLSPSIEVRPPLPRATGARCAMRRVCHLSMTLQTGGLERLLVEFGRHHDAGRFALRFVALDRLGPPADELRRLGFEVDTLRFPETGRLAALRRLSQLLDDERIDILHTHNTYAHFYGTIAARMAGVPVVINTQHGRGCGDRWKDRWLFRLANRGTARIVGVSHDAADLCRGQDPRSRERMTTIWNGIDVERFAFQGPADSLTAVSVARLSPLKDFPTLLRAVALARAEVPEFRLTIIGDGAERARLERLAVDLQVNGVVQFLGERTDVADHLGEAGFFVSSSRSEGISLTLLEAMAVGLPVLATRVGGTPEIVEDGWTGRLVESGDPEALAAGIVAMCRERHRWREMGREGRERVERCFEIRGMVRRYESLYDEPEGPAI